MIKVWKNFVKSLLCIWFKYGVVSYSSSLIFFFISILIIGAFFFIIFLWTFKQIIVVILISSLLFLLFYFSFDLLDSDPIWYHTRVLLFYLSFLLTIFVQVGIVKLNSILVILLLILFIWALLLTFFFLNLFSNLICQHEIITFFLCLGEKCNLLPYLDILVGTFSVVLDVVRHKL